MISTESSIRYDRQVRLWGEEGQASIGATSVCLIGADSLGTEITKSLILAGVQSIFIVDDAIVNESDIGQNFFLDFDDVGKYRSEATLQKLLELNPSVSGQASTSSPTNLSQSDAATFAKFSVVVSANQIESIELAYASILYPISVPFICVKTFGLLGTIRICTKEHTIANSHYENLRPDFRLDAPFGKLLEMVNETNLEEMSIEQLRHTPYLILLFKALEIFRKNRQDMSAFPASYSERKEIQNILLSFRRSSDESGSKESENFDEARNAVTRAFQRTTIEPDVLAVLNDEKCRTSTQPFWLICEGLKRFVEKNGFLPTRGTLPDMTSDTERYTRLASMFHEKATQEAKEVLELTKIVEKERGVGDVISEEMCFRFCKNSDRIKFQRGEMLNYEKEIEKLVEIIKNLPIEKVENEQEMKKKVDCSIWLIILRAVDKFQKEKGRYPGTNGVPCTIDSFDLKQRIDSIVNEVAGEDSNKVIEKIPAEAIAEVCRFGAAELHVISSFIGGIAAQEVIKLATNQYVPLNNTFIFDGHTQESVTIKF